MDATKPIFDVVFRLNDGATNFLAQCAAVPRVGEFVKIKRDAGDRRVLKVLHSLKTPDDPNSESPASDDVCVYLGEEE